MRSAELERNRGQAGFTLIEVLVALVVFALVAVSVYLRSADVSVQTARLEERSVAMWLARDALERTKLDVVLTEELPRPGRDVRIEDAFGRQWSVSTEVTATSDENLVGVEIEVSPEDAPSETVAARLDGYVGRYR